MSVFRDFRDVQRMGAWLSTSASANQKLSQNWEVNVVTVILVPWHWLALTGWCSVLIITATTDITLTVSTFKGSPASPSPPPPPPADLDWANDLLADPHYSSLGYFCNLWFGLNKYVDKNTLLIDQNNMRWAVSALENDSLSLKDWSSVILSRCGLGQSRGREGEEWKIWEIIEFLPRYLTFHFPSIMWTQNLQESIFRYLLVAGAQESILSISWHSAGWSLLSAWDASLGAPSVSISHNTLLRYPDRPTNIKTHTTTIMRTQHFWGDF